jgi:hypothetical protein
MITKEEFLKDFNGAEWEFGFNVNEFKQGCDVVFFRTENLLVYISKFITLAGTDFYIGYDNYFGLGAWSSDSDSDDPVQDLVHFIDESGLELWDLVEAMNIVLESAKQAASKYWAEYIKAEYQKLIGAELA